MLGKMIKHEFKATGRLYLPMFLITIALTPILSLIFKISGGRESVIGGLISGTSVFFYVVMLIGLCFASFIYVIIRFYKTVATSEAYLTFCLPVKTKDILISKLFVSVIWEFLSVGVVLLSIFITLCIQGSSIPQRVFDTICKVAPIVAAEYGSVFLFFVHLAVMILISSIAGTLTFFLAICLGQLFNEHRVIMSIAMYLVVYMISQFISMAVFMPFILSGEKSIVIGKVTAANISFNGLPTMGMMFAVSALEIVLGVAYYIVCHTVMKKKMNVR